MVPAEPLHPGEGSSGLAAPLLRPRATRSGPRRFCGAVCSNRRALLTRDCALGGGRNAAQPFSRGACHVQVRAPRALSPLRRGHRQRHVLPPSLREVRSPRSTASGCARRRVRRRGATPRFATIRATHAVCRGVHRSGTILTIDRTNPFSHGDRCAWSRRVRGLVQGRDDACDACDGKFDNFPSYARVKKVTHPGDTSVTSVIPADPRQAGCRSTIDPQRPGAEQIPLP